MKFELMIVLSLVDISHQKVFHILECETAPAWLYAKTVKQISCVKRQVKGFCVCACMCDSKGDFRMVIGEDKSKVHNIVKDNIQHFQILYSNILRDCPQVVYKPQQGKLEVNYDINNTHTLT